MVVVEGYNLQSDVVERLETKDVFDVDGVGCLTFGRVALDKQTITDVLEITVGLTFRQIDNSSVANLGDGARETDKTCIRAFHAPLSQQVASLSSLMTREE